MEKDYQGTFGTFNTALIVSNIGKIQFDNFCCSKHISHGVHGWSIGRWTTMSIPWKEEVADY